MISLLLVTTSGHDFAFRREDVETVLQLPHLTRQPGDISLIEGWMNLRGEPLPVISLADVLDLPSQPVALSDHLVLTLERPRVIWRVARVEGLGEVSWESLRLMEHAADPNPRYVAQFSLDGSTTVNLLNVASLLLAEEQQRLKVAQERRESRLQELEGAEESHV